MCLTIGILIVTLLTSIYKRITVRGTNGDKNVLIDPQNICDDIILNA